MNHHDDREYFAARAAAARALEQQADSPGIAAIHREMADSYERMAARPQLIDHRPVQRGYAA